MTDPGTTSAEHLLRQAGSIRALARGLLGDADGATEAAHEAWLAGQGDGDSGRYVRSSLRNRLRGWRRSSRRRDERERDVASSDPAPAPDEIAAQAEIRHRVLEAVTGLAEPLRTTIWLRFFEDRPPRWIARRMAVPVNTVRSRVRLGLDALRGRLDTLHDGDRERWQRALLPAAGYALGAGLVVPVLGVLTMKKITMTAAAIAVAFAGGNLAMHFARPDRSVAPRDSTAVAAVESSNADAAKDPAPGRERVASSAAAPQRFTVRGAIDLRSSVDGSRVPAGNGMLRLGTSNESEPRVVPVENGRFEIAATGSAVTFSVIDVLLDEQAIEHPHPDWHCTAEDSTVSLEATAFPPGRLLVLDAATRSHLHAIDVAHVERATIDGLPTDAFWFPGKRGRAWLRDRSSPLVVPADAREAEYLVSAPGYAWQPVEIAHEHGGERLVFLEPGGDLRVVVRELPAASPPFLRVRDGTGACVREGRLTQDTAELTRLCIGRYEVAVEHGERDADPARRLVVGSGTVAVTRSGRAELVIACEPEPALEQERRTLTGTLTANAAWGRTYAQVLAIPLDRPPLAGEVSTTASRRRSWPLGEPATWTCSGLLPGRYRLLVVGFGIEHDVEIPANGAVPEVTLEIPDPVEAELLVVDASSRAPRHSSSIWLTRRGPDGVDRFLVAGRFIDGERWLLRCLPGDYRLAAFSPWRVERDITVGPGSAHELAVAPTFGTLLEFRCGDARIPVDPGNVRLEPRGSGGEVVRVTDVGFKLSTHVSAPGRYVLHVDEPGYRPVRLELEFNLDWHTTVVPLSRS